MKLMRKARAKRRKAESDVSLVSALNWRIRTTTIAT